ncbi:ISKra4 family transposase [Kiloniella sp.]|uniref:ISKra4 family transposase n=1 Tax=Kiloniella sp. TaxID=1938587 RepID=UPI003B017EEB
MQFTIQVSVKDDFGETTIEDIISLDKVPDNPDDIGLSLMESKSLLKSLQNLMVSHQAELYTKTHLNCPHCQKKRRIKGHYGIHYRTLFGIVPLSSLRVYNCDCKVIPAKTTSLLTDWIPDHNSPELQYIETKWASLMAYGLTSNLLKDILPVGTALNASTVRNHLHKVAKRQENDLEGKPEYISGCAYEWGNLPKPGKPITVGIDGGYVRNWYEKKTNFEVVAGKSFSKEKAPKRFGFVQKIDDHPRKKLMSMLSDQGMQNNQQITFLSDGADNLRDLQFMMYPESLHILDWFHVTMRFTVLNQFAKGMKKSDPKDGAMIFKDLESAKWYLWHGNVQESLEKIGECCDVCYDDELHYENRKKLALLRFVE